MAVVVNLISVYFPCSGGNQKRPSSDFFGESDSNRNNKNNDNVNIGSILGLEDEKPIIVGRL